MAKPFALLALVLFTSACADPGLGETTPGVPAPIGRVVTTPGLYAPVSGWVAGYHASHGQSLFRLDILPPAAALKAVEEGEADLLVAGIEPPAGWFVTPLGKEGIAVIVNPEIPVRSFSIETLADLFTGRIASWEVLGGPASAVQPVVPLGGDELRARFEGLVLSGSPSTPAAYLAPSPEAMVSLVGESAGAIGVLPLSALSESVRVVRVDGVLPGPSTIASGSYPFTLDVLALAPREPEGVLREWLVWVQSSRLEQPPLDAVPTEE